MFHSLILSSFPEARAECRVPLFCLLIFKLEHEPHLAWVLGFDQRTKSVRVVGADPQPVRVVQEIERFRAKLNSGAFVIDQNGLHEAQVHGNGSWCEEAVSPEAYGTCRDRIGSCRVGVRRQERIQGTATSPRKNGGERNSVEAFPKPSRGRFQILNR